MGVVFDVIRLGKSQIITLEESLGKEYVSKNLFAIPKQYGAKGGDSDKVGFNRQIRDENGNITNEFYYPQVAYSDAIYESIQNTVKWVLDEKSGLLIEKKEDINKAAEKFNKTVDKEGSKAIVDAFKEFLSRL